MRKYQKIIKVLKELSEEKVNHILYGMWTKNTLLYIAIFLLLYELSTVVLFAFGRLVWFILVMIMFVILMFFLLSRKVGIGITENRFIYVIFKRIGYKEKRIYEIPYDKIRYIDVKKRLGSVIVKMSFISDVGKLERIKFNFKTIMIGSENFNKSSKEIYEKLLNVQKIVDKGDF